MLDDHRPAPEEIERLVRRAQAKDEAAFEELFLGMRPRLEAWIIARLGSRLRTRLDIEDIVQEVQLAAFRGIGSYASRGGEHDFWRWLSTIVNNRIRDLHDHHFVAKKRTPDRERMLRSSLQAAVTSPSGQARRAEDHELVLEALAKLEANDQEILRLCALDGLSHQEAGVILGITPKNVSVRLSRARGRLREAMHGA